MSLAKRLENVKPLAIFNTFAAFIALAAAIPIMQNYSLTGIRTAPGTKNFYTATGPLTGVHLSDTRHYDAIENVNLLHEIAEYVTNKPQPRVLYINASNSDRTDYRMTQYPNGKREFVYRLQRPDLESEFQKADKQLKETRDAYEEAKTDTARTHHHKP